jgi:DNA-binding GntR family transcriptional regulator
MTSRNGNLAKKVATAKRGAPSPAKIKARNSGIGSLPDQISRRIVQEFILGEKLKPGELLPGEKQLCELYDVSRPTIRSAIKSLHDHGVISVRNGVGAVVLPRGKEILHRLDSLASIDTFAIESGHAIETTHLSWETVAADFESSRKLRIPAGDPVLLAKRLKIIDSAPAAWIIDALPAELVDANDIKQRFHGSVLDAMLEDETRLVDYADSEVKPCHCDEALSPILKKPVGALLLFMDTTVVTIKSRPLIWGRVWLDPDKFRFAFRRRHFG